MIKKKEKKMMILLGLLVVMPVLVLAGRQVVQYLSRAGGVKADIVVDAEAILGPMPTPWRNLAQGGEESEPMLDDVTSQLKQLQTEYVRIDHIYDIYQVVSLSEGRLRFDWSRLDATVSDILRSGAKPFLSLSYMPEAISESDIVGKPRDWGLWEEVVKETVEHFSGYQGMGLEDVYYEVWNEPDLFGDWRTYGGRNYLKMYYHASRGAQRASDVKAFKLGGPATTALYLNWVNRLLNYVEKNNLRLDFYSWHRYTRDLKVMEDEIEEISRWLEKHPEKMGVELIISEWGHDSENDAGYDGRFGAIYTMAGSRLMMGRVNKGFVFEVKDGPGNEKYWGRWGLLTHEKYGAIDKKPRFEALMWLNNLGNQRVSLKGEGSWVKGISAYKEGVLQTLLINYDGEGRHSELVPVTFNNLPAKEFVYSRGDFLGGRKSVKVATDSASWRTEELLPANSAALLELRFD